MIDRKNPISLLGSENVKSLNKYVTKATSAVTIIGTSMNGISIITVPL